MEYYYVCMFVLILGVGYVLVLCGVFLLYVRMLFYVIIYLCENDSLKCVG